MLNIVAASLSGVANLSLAGVFVALWWLERDARFNLAWAGGFAAIGVATTALIAHRELGIAALLIVAIIGTGAGVALLFAGTRLYLGGRASSVQLAAWTGASWAALALALLHGMEAVEIVGSAMLAGLYGWIGLIFAARPGIERFVGGFFLARALLAASYPVLAPPFLAPAFVTMHLLVLATGLALLLAAFARTRKQLIQAEREERERAAQIDALYADTPALLAVLDGGGHYITASTDWLKFMGYEREEIVGRHRMRFAPPDVQARVAADIVPRLRRDRRVDDFEHEARRKDGSVVSLRTSLKAHRNPITGRFEIIALSVDQTAQKQAEQAARRTQNLLERIVEVLPAAVSVKDTELRFVLWNARAAELYDLSAAQVIGRRLNEVRQDATTTMMEAADREVLRGETPPPREALVEFDGKQRWILMSKTPLLSESGAVEGIISASLDITELKQIQTALQQSQQYLTEAQRLGRMGYIRSDYRTGRSYWSETMFELRGVPPRESFSIEEGMAFVHPEDVPAYVAARDAGIAEKRSFQVELRVLRPDRQLQWELATGHPQFDPAGECTGLLLVVQATTERKLAELALRASEAKLSGAFAGTAEAMFIVRRRDNVVVEMNEAAENLFGWSRDEVLDQSRETLDIWVDPDELRRMRSNFEAAGALRDYPARLRNRSGQEVECLLTASRYEAGSETYNFWIIRDITEMRRAERRIAALNAANEAALRQIRSIADNLPVLIAYADRERRCQFVNRTGEIWYNRPASELIGERLGDLVTPNMARPLAPVIAEVLQGRRQRVEPRLLYPDGNERDVEITYIPEMLPDGSINGYYTLATDLTERKQAELALRASEVRFTGAFYGSTDMMAIMRATDNVFLEINDAWLGGSGFSRDEVIGRRADELNTWVDPDQLAAARRRLAEEGVIRALVANMRRKDGAIREVRMSATRIGTGDDAYYFWVGRDVTGELAATRRIAALNAANEAALRQIRNIADNLPVLIAHVDRDRRFLFVNRTGEQWFNRPASELVGRSIAEVMGEEFTQRSADVAADVLAGQPATIEGRIRYPDGKEREVEIVYVPDIGTDGKVNSYYSLVTDITERRATEAQLRQAQRMEAIGKLTGGVAHDFNNLLGVISGNLELVDESIGVDGEARRMIRTALRATERGATLTRSLLAYARQQPLLPSAVDLNGLVREMADLLRRTVPESIQIEVVADAGLWPCEADPGQLQNALLNLVVNARDAMPEGGRLTIESGNARLDDEYAAAHAELTPGQYVMLAVSDTGTGMLPEVVARAFDPFFTTKDVGKGTGLGLSMVYGFAKQSRGHVRIYSEVGHGTTVRLYLPRAREAKVTSTAAAEIADGKGECILLVEDNLDFRRLTLALLHSFGYRVLDAADAASALKVLDEHPEIELLLTDVVLPGPINGERLAAAARRSRPRLKVLYMSGYTENAILHHGRVDPGVQLLQKPFRKRDLAAKVRAVLDEGEAA